MGFLAPYMFWGLLAISVPLLIHLWNGRKGDKVYWAAFRFLEENDNKPIRHIRLEQWILMMLRMILISLLVILMVQLFFDFLDEDSAVQKVHLVEPNQELLQEFRFEMNQAIENGDKVILLNEDLELLDLELFEIESVKGKMNLYRGLQDNLGSRISLYLTGFRSSFDRSEYLVDSLPQVFIAELAKPNFSKKAFETEGGKFLFIDKDNELTLSQNGNFSFDELEKGNLRVGVKILNPEWEKRIRSALKAIEEVYELSFEIKESDEVDMLFSDDLQDVKENIMVFDLLHDWTNAQYPNVYFLQSFREKDLKSRQILPSEILGAVLDFHHLSGQEVRMDKEGVQQKFVVGKGNHLSPQTQKANAQEIIWVMFLLVLIAERIVANKSNL